MLTSKKCPFYRDSQNFTRSREYCDLDGHPRTCDGNIQFCENRDALRKRLLEQENREGWNIQGDEGQEEASFNYKVLVVDDEEPIRKMMFTLLKFRLGHQCITASNGIEALNQLKENKFDAVITDIVMPEMDGITLTKEIMILYPNLPIMVMMGHGKQYLLNLQLRQGLGIL